MKAMLLKQLTSLLENDRPLAEADVPEPEPAAGEILVRVNACGVCHTELDEIEGRTPPPQLPVVLGHEVIGTVAACGAGTARFDVGARVGVGWIHSACGECPACRAGNENLCPDFRATGRDANGGYAEYLTIPEASAYPIPDVFTDAEAAPLLCAGAIGYRSVRLADLHDGSSLGLVGFGGSAHLVLQMVRHRTPNCRVYAFSRNEGERRFARELGAVWAGGIDAECPEKLDRIIDTTPVWRPIVFALANLAPGGRLIINAIRKEDADKDALLALDYPTHLWLEKEIKSVANVCRRDCAEFLELAAEIPLRPEVQEFSLTEANRALVELKRGGLRGAKVLLT
jgi:propanol-preferring alcohol dehydrogenase